MRKTMDAAPTRSMVIGGGILIRNWGRTRMATPLGLELGIMVDLPRACRQKNGMTSLTMEHSHAWIRFIALVVLISQPKGTDPGLTTFLLSKPLRNDFTCASLTAVPEGCNSSLTNDARDHVPMIASFDYYHLYHNQCKKDIAAGWDRDKLSKCLQRELACGNSWRTCSVPS